ncbi:MAG: PAS domain S-box protein [Thermoleophilaceae bacterium]|nr:PAS domain S-box protein [Thermoleophilaceae bacterium]
MRRSLTGIKDRWTSAGPGGSVVRHLLPAAAATLFVLAFLRWQGEQLGLYGTTAGLLLMTAASIGIISGLVLHLARSLDHASATQLEVQQRLRHSSQYFELSHDMVCTAGFDGVFRELNHAWTEALGWTETELRSRPFVEFVHPDDRERTAQETACLADGKTTADFYNRYATKDGQWRWIEWKARADLEDGTIYASARDVTHRKSAEAALERGERQTRQILATAHDAFVSIDGEGTIIDWNPQAEASFGWSREEALGRELATTIIPEGNREAHTRGLARFLETGEGKVVGKRLELTALNRDGYEFPVELTISPLMTDRGYIFNAFLRDISERKRATEDIADARDLALQASSTKSMFVATASHEIRTPINGVIGVSEMLLDTDLNDEQRGYAETIISSGEALVEIIDDLLDFSKIEAGRLDLDLADVDLRETIAQACSMLAVQARCKGLELVVVVDADVPALVRADAGRWRQVVANFVSNSIKFTAEGEITVRASASRSTGSTTVVRLEVTDTGIGIEDTALGQLFEPYSQADGSTTRLFGGTGLGLAISKQLIELMGGQIGVESQIGRGSSFWFEVEVEVAVIDGREEGSEGVSEPVDPADCVPPNGSSRCILVVEDNPVNQLVTGRLVEKCGFEAQIAGNGRQALEAMSDGRFAAVLMDCQMPELDGDETTREIRRRALGKWRIPIIAVTANAMHGERERCIAQGADDYLTKPLRHEALRGALDRWVPDSPQGLLSPSGSRGPAPRPV